LAPAPGSLVPSMAFATGMQARLPLGPLARGFLTTPQASLDAADWPVAPRPASTPGSRPTPGAALPGTLASPRAGLPPAGCRELVARLHRRSLLICAGTPGQQRVRVDGDLLLAAGRMDGAEPGSTVERPQRSEDERPGRRRGPSQDQHSEGRIPGQRIGTTSEQATGGAAMAGVRGRPALSWSAGRWPGDVMIDGVSHRVRPLVLSGPASVAWRQEHCGSWPRRISGVGRARTSRIGQATRPRSGVSDGGA
jgi:hypothetical protein